MATKHRTSITVAAVLALVVTAVFPSTGAFARDATGPAIGECVPGGEGALDLLPDVKMAPLYGLTIRVSSTGRKHLRFGTKSWNSGDGPIEVRADGRSGDTMTRISQRIYDSLGGCRDVLQPAATVWYAGDGHNHWHVSQYMVTQLYRKAGGEALRVRKSGFCLLDLHHANNPPANSPAERVYWNGACGDAYTQSLAMGISVGYADDYLPLIAQQWIDITGLPKASYRLCAAVNPFGWWLEREGVGENNYFWYDLTLNPSKNTFTIGGQGRGPCLIEE